MSANYTELKDKHPEMTECFIAFSNSQFEEGKIKAKIEDKEIFSAGSGLYGTKKGISDFMSFHVSVDEEISNNCDPQEVYNYEYANHECGYVGDDIEAIEIVISYFGKKKAKTIKRKHAITPIEKLKID